jgi:general secretion pathway protein K
MRSEALAARNAVALAQARTAADGAVDRMVYELARPRTPESWKANGVLHGWADGEIALEASARDEGGKIDLNNAQDGLLKGLFVNVGSLEDAEASALVDAVVDWRDADELRRPNGAEAPDYLAAQSRYKPSNSRFESVGELSRVRGMTPALFARVSDALTVHSRQTGINALSADRQVLLALPGATPEIVDDYVARRDEAIAQNLPPPPFPPEQAIPAGAVPNWRIRAQARLPDGVTFVREAVVRATADPRRPYLAYLWGEAMRPPAPAPPTDDATAASPATALRPS